MDAVNQIANGTVPGSSSLAEAGVIGAVCLIFLYAVIHLWRTGRSDAKDHAEREKSWEASRKQLEADFEKKAKELAETYAMQLEERVDQFLAREDGIRKDFADRMERVATEATKAAEKQNEVLDKIFQRFVGPRRGRTGG